MDCPAIVGVSVVRSSRAGPSLNCLKFEVVAIFSKIKLNLKLVALPNCIVVDMSPSRGGRPRRRAADPVARMQYMGCLSPERPPLPTADVERPAPQIVAAACSVTAALLSGEPNAKGPAGVPRQRNFVRHSD